MTEQIIKVTSKQFASVQQILQRGTESVYGVLSETAAMDALRHVGIEPQWGRTYRFEVIPD